MLHTVLLLVGINILAIISPGPDLFLILRNSSRYTRRAALCTVWGITLGIVIHIAYCILGIGLVIANSVMLFNLIKLLGAAYLIYIGIKSLRSSSAPLVTEEARAERSADCWLAFREGLICNVTNPKVTLMMLSVFTQVITPGTLVSEQLVYGSVFVVITILYWSGLVLFMQKQRVRSFVSGIQTAVDRVFGGILIALGLKVAFSD